MQLFFTETEVEYDTHNHPTFSVTCMLKPEQIASAHPLPSPVDLPTQHRV